MEQLEENSKTGLEQQRRAAAKAARARAIAEVRARARGEYTEGGADSPGAGAGGSKKPERGKQRGGGASASTIDKGNGRRLLHLCTDSSQETDMHAIDLRRLVRQNRAPEIQRRARIRDRLLALKDRRVKLPKILHVPVSSASVAALYRPRFTLHALDRLPSRCSRTETGVCTAVATSSLSKLDGSTTRFTGAGSRRRRCSGRRGRCGRWRSFILPEVRGVLARYHGRRPA